MKQWERLRNHPELWNRFFIREKVLTAIRRFFLDRGFHEVETPLLTGSLPPESYLSVFETTLLTRANKKVKAYLPTSPEPFLKKLLVAGIGNCFSLTKSFRNTETNSDTHNPEFTILEWYRTGCDYTVIMKDCEDLLLFINTYLMRTLNDNDGLTLPTVLTYQGSKIDISSPWERLTVTEAFKRYAHMDLTENLTRDKIAKTAHGKGYAVAQADSWEALFNLIWLNEIDPQLTHSKKPIVIYEYPAIGGVAGLARKKKKDPRFAERFEYYIGGLELGDCYSELTDWKEQMDRFRVEHRELKRLGKTVPPIDVDFIKALKAGMPQSSGIAVGVDRLIMLFADTTNIADTMFFPIDDLFDL